MLLNTLKIEVTFEAFCLAEEEKTKKKCFESFDDNQIN
jgi:hypothetical protein